ncbi:hypothetical protein TSOC_006826 [Tetrabaena socialis]|uniref:Uncharacterized protein n=1 Tax=Tetrabaena socialis TaxID=47790 RepID=A0A2J8A2J7_9CHLO|nr:hypothetical protein TSOC_006826 [Tetrabaena socialis]|eukprot:PNH06742.1 hypothetical protein TSOC_006826 [Tetrabaena socialis]
MGRGWVGGSSRWKTSAGGLWLFVGACEAGEAAVIPDLASCLAVPELVEATEKAMWAIFMRSRDPRVNELMTEGCSHMRSPATHERALEVFGRMIAAQPSFTEPYHFGAASGMGLCLLQLSRYEEALAAFEAALAIHPNMPNIRRFVADLRRQMEAGPSAGA